MNNVHLHYLKHARKHTHLPLKDMAELLEMDVSNLSKYERGKKHAPLHVILSYHILSRIPLERLFRVQLREITAGLQSRINDILEQLEHVPKTPDNRSKENRLGALLANLGDDPAPENTPA